MQYEVEQKFRVHGFDDVEQRLQAMGADLEQPVVQRDLYFAHPSRDFACTDEALRIRSVADANFVTYKGPKIDRTTKTRREIELPLTDGQAAADRFAELLEALGFRRVRHVRKRRRCARVPWRDRTVDVALDEVEQLGCFVELELSADPAGLDAARTCLAELARHLGLQQSERRSYLELLLTQAGDGEHHGHSKPTGFPGAQP